MVTEQPAIGRNEGGKKPEVTNKVSALGDLENGVATIPERQLRGRALGVLGENRQVVCSVCDTLGLRCPTGH